MQIGIDLGGTKVEIIALNDYSETLYRRRVDTPKGDYNSTLKTIELLVANCERELTEKASSIGIGIPGAISPLSGKVKNANSTCLIGHPIDKDLKQLLGREVTVANDADCFTLSEAVDGSGQGYQSVFGVILGTGVGGGIAINQQLINGPNAISGEWGHNPLPWITNKDTNGRACYCGKDNCIETFLSGPGFSQAFNREHHSNLNAEQIWKEAEQNDESAMQYCELYKDQLARALAGVINILDPGIIVLGGGLSNQKSIYRTIESQIAEYVFSDTFYTPVLKAEHGDSSGVRGAAWLGSHNSQKRN